MKLPLSSVLALGWCAASFAADEKPAAPSPAPFKDNRDKVSYSYGVNIANTMKMQGFEINPDELSNGLRDALAGKAKLDEKEVRETLVTFSQELRNKRMEKMRADAEKGKKEGEDWLAANAKKTGVKSFPDGLQYKVLVSGKGPQPKPTDTVSAHYKGTLIDGTEFDSSYTSGKPLTGPLAGLIPGWQEALTNMHVGDKWELYVPAALAYGERGQPQNKIGPNATLIFEMELLNTQAGPPAATPPTFPSIKSGAPNIKVQPAPGANTPIRVQPSQPAK